MSDISTAEKLLRAPLPVEDRIEAVEEDGRTRSTVAEHFNPETGALDHDVVIDGSEVHASEAGHILAKIGGMMTHVGQEGASSNLQNGSQELQANNGSEVKEKVKVKRAFAGFVPHHGMFSKDTSVDPAHAEVPQVITTIGTADLPESVSQEIALEPVAQNSEVPQEAVKAPEVTSGLKDRILNRQPEWLKSTSTKLRKGIALRAWNGLSADRVKSDLDDLGNLITAEVAEQAKIEESQLDTGTLTKTFESQVLGPETSTGEVTPGIDMPQQTGQAETSIEVPPVPPTEAGNNGIDNLQDELARLNTQADASVNIHNGGGTEAEAMVDSSGEAVATGVQGADMQSALSSNDAQPASGVVTAPASEELPATPPELVPTPKEVGQPRRGFLGRITSAISNVMIGGSSEQSN